MEGRKLVVNLYCFGLSSWSHSNANAYSSLTSGSVRWCSAFPKLESASARARRRRRRLTRLEESSAAGHAPNIRGGHRQRPKDEDDVVPAYPNGRPWRVLWPNPHGNPSFVVESKPTRRIPRWKDIQVGWAKYLETWEDGIRGVPSPEKLREQEALETAQEMARTNPEDNEVSTADKLQSNVTQNLQVARTTAMDLFEQAKDKSSIHSSDDLRRVAAEMMKLATECLKEFMSGYRQGRDQEIDKMLHEYFQDQNPDAKQSDETSSTVNVKKTKRRKPRRAVLR